MRLWKRGRKPDPEGRANAEKPCPPGAEPCTWDDLPEAVQTELRIEYGRYLDSLPPTCSLETKEARFAAWLAERGVRYP